MFAPTKIWRRWHRKVNLNQRRFAIVSAIAATAIPSLVFARGHRVEQVPELPLVLADDAQRVVKTKSAVELLKHIAAYADIEKVKESRKMRAGKGKARNRRFRQRRGPLVIYKENEGIVKAFRNIPGVELAPVSALNLLLLAPGGHLGRFCIWTRGAFAELTALYGSFTEAAKLKSNYLLPAPILSQASLSSIINSEKVQNVLRPAGDKFQAPKPNKKNPLRNKQAMARLNPYHRRARQLTVERDLKRSQQKKGKSTRRAAADFVDSLRKD